MRRISQLKTKLLITAGYGCILLIFWYFQLPCVYQYFFHTPCPGCGMSRAVFSVLRLDLAAAFRYHPMFFAMPVLYLYFLYDGKLLNHKILDRLVLSVFGAGFLIQWVLKLL